MSSYVSIHFMGCNLAEIRDRSRLAVHQEIVGRSRLLGMFAIKRLGTRYQCPIGNRQT
jgi:hypothetical protein